MDLIIRVLLIELDRIELEIYLQNPHLSEAIQSRWDLWQLLKSLRPDSPTDVAFYQTSGMIRSSIEGSWVRQSQSRPETAPLRESDVP